MHRASEDRAVTYENEENCLSGGDCRIEKRSDEKHERNRGEVEDEVEEEDGYEASVVEETSYCD